ncbi:hypothetical protein pb186bvf_008782 [Paramecium bursaria]
MIQESLSQHSPDKFSKNSVGLIDFFQKIVQLKLPVNNQMSIQQNFSFFNQQLVQGLRLEGSLLTIINQWQLGWINQISSSRGKILETISSKLNQKYQLQQQNNSIIEEDSSQQNQHSDVYGNESQGQSINKLLEEHKLINKRLRRTLMMQFKSKSQRTNEEYEIIQNLLIQQISKIYHIKIYTRWMIKQDHINAKSDILTYQIIWEDLSQLYAWNIINNDIVPNLALEAHFEYNDQPWGVQDSDQLLLVNKKQMKIINLNTMKLQQIIVLSFMSNWQIHFIQIYNYKKIIINVQNRNSIMSLKKYKIIQSFYHNYSKIIGTDKHSLAFQTDKKILIFKQNQSNKLIRTYRKQQLQTHNIYYSDKFMIQSHWNNNNKRECLIDVINTCNLKLFSQYSTQIEYRGALYLKEGQQIVILKTREIQFYNSQTGELDYEEDLQIGQSFNRKVLQMEWNQGIIIFYGKASVQLPNREFSLFRKLF